MRPLPSLRKPEPSAEEPEPGPAEPAVPERQRWRVSLKMLLVLMAMVAIPFAAWGGMRRVGVEDRTFYILFAAAAPVLVLVLVGLVHELTRRR